ncbi:MAG: hypothetical protein WA891_07135 [Acidobacteriaceae bacterium]|jgi:hypothetical protein
MIRRVLALTWVLLLSAAAWAQGNPAVRVEPPEVPGAPFSGQAANDFRMTQTAVVRDYLEAWRNFHAAFEENRPDLLSRSFVGSAHEVLDAAIAQQAKLGLHTDYQDRSHDMRIVFYRPGGGSLEIIDNVEYDQQTLDAHGTLAAQTVHAQYVVVLTPTETRWAVRIFQAQPDGNAAAISRIQNLGKHTDSDYLSANPTEAQTPAAI